MKSVVVSLLRGGLFSGLTDPVSVLCEHRPRLLEELSLEELDEDDSEKNPVSSYAIAKWKAEQKINTLSNNDFTITSFRPSTVFGASPRLRCDIVFNNLVACAYTTGKIEIKSDGSPWRPVVHVKDVCSAFIAGLEAPKEKVEGRSFNVGIENGNFTVKELAIAAQTDNWIVRF